MRNTAPLSDLTKNAGIGRHTVGNALVLHARDKISSEAQSLALTVAEDDENDIVVLDLHDDLPVGIWDSVAAALPRRRRGIRLVVCGATQDTSVLAGQWLSDRLGRSVVAPYGHLIRGTSGALFVHAAEGSGWVRYHRGRAPSWEAKRYPQPVWDGAATEAMPTSATGMVEPLPGGVWIRDSQDDGALNDHWQWLASAMPCQPEAFTVVLGCPGRPPLALDDIARFWRELADEGRAHARFIQYGPVQLPAGEPLGQALADLLAQPVVCYTGVPVGRPDQPRMHTVAADGRKGWQVYARELGYTPRPRPTAPAELPRILSYQAPEVLGDEITPLVFRYADDAVVEVVQSGLWMRSPEVPRHADRIRARRADPAVHAVVIEDAQPARTTRLRELADDLVARLDDATRERSSLQLASTVVVTSKLPAAARGALPDGMTFRFTAADLDLDKAPADPPPPAEEIADLTVAAPVTLQAPAPGRAGGALTATGETTTAAPSAATRAFRRPLSSVVPVPGPEREPAVAATAFAESPATWPASPSPVAASPAAVPSGRDSSGSLSPGSLSPGSLSPGSLSPGSLSPGSLSSGVDSAELESLRSASVESGVPGPVLGAPDVVDGVRAASGLDMAAPASGASDAIDSHSAVPIAAAQLSRAAEEGDRDLGLRPEAGEIGHDLRLRPEAGEISRDFGVRPDVAEPDRDVGAWPEAGEIEPGLPTRAGTTPRITPKPTERPELEPETAVRLLAAVAEATQSMPVITPAGRRAGHAEAAATVDAGSGTGGAGPRHLSAERPRALRFQATPAADAVGVADPGELDREREWLRTALGREFDQAASSVSRVLAEYPGFQAGPDTMADAVAVRLYLSEVGDGVDEALRAGANGPQVPFARCVSGGLVRLPSHRGATMQVAGLSAEDLRRVRERRVLQEWGFTHALTEPPAGLPGDVDVLIWSMTGRRTRLLEPEGPHGADARVVFLPGTSFKVLDVLEPGVAGRGLLLLRELSADEPAERHVPFDDLALSALHRSIEQARTSGRVARVGSASADRFQSVPGLW
ncbi:hypothetical protein [Actinoplanes sp. N902-109]|uniref:hypothetical protein n=1 Tax=Actinoplanes sp. (strain N902-109) TaxID=649831 RepID=UPI0003296557|nr:hypothetical protein [Actinoplanes sp. N902-109]AGL14113.1 hypothetical protein L083_0603 [Actinoplanes sp. N902-109]